MFFCGVCHNGDGVGGSVRHYIYVMFFIAALWGRLHNVYKYAPLWGVLVVFVCFCLWAASRPVYCFCWV